MNTLLENIRASAILMKNLPSTLSGDALLISREKARRIGYELEACEERIGKKVPQGVEEFIRLHGYERVWNSYTEYCVSQEDLRDYLSGMAIVPADCMTTIARDVEYSPHTSRHTPFLRVNFAYDDYDSRDRVYAMLAATKEKNDGL